MEITLELAGIRKSFGRITAVDGISLQVPGGTIFGLLGPNGAGKTTTIRMIMDIIAPDTGEVRFFGRPRRQEDLRRVGYLPEERGLYRKMTVTDTLLFFGELHGKKRSELRPQIQWWLDRVELSAWANKKVEELSKGMQQKIQLVSTLLHDPDIVILDEPFAGLDPLNQQLFKEVLAGYKSRGKTILFSTHVMEQAEKLCDHVCLISKGRKILDGELKAIKERLGGHAFRVVAQGDLERLRTVDGVDHVIVQDGAAKIFLRPEAEEAEVLAQAVGFLKVREFRSEEPDLEEIFIKAVNDAD